MTHGSSTACRCPACKMTISTPLHNKRELLAPVSIPGGTEEGTVVCPHCKTELYFWSRMECVVELERASKVT